MCQGRFLIDSRTKSLLLNKRTFVFPFLSAFRFCRSTASAIESSTKRTTVSRAIMNSPADSLPLGAVLLECDSRLRGEGLIRATFNLALTRHVLTMRPPRSTPMSITSALVEKTKVRAKMLLLDTILIKSASRLVRPKTHSQRRQLILLQYASRALQLKTASHLARRTVFRFVQDSIAEAVDRQI